MQTALLITASLWGASDPKDSVGGQLLTTDQLLGVLKEKGELTWAGGEYRMMSRKVDGPDVLGLVLERREDGKVVFTLSAKTARLTADSKRQKLRVFFEEGEVDNKFGKSFLFDQEVDFPPPRQPAKR